MSIVRCPEGHFYDDSKHSSCPHCGAGAKKQPSAPTTPYTKSTIFQTVAEINPENPANPEIQEKDQSLNLADAIKAAKESKPQTDGVEKTIGIYSAPDGIEAVVGWLVITEGPEKGRDFRLIAGRNFVGRGSDMNVILSKDNAVSASKHAIIVYDPSENLFIAMTGESHELFYHNGKVVLEPAVLNAYDTLKIGRTMLMFIPCCSEKFKWEIPEKAEG